ncbi:MAG: protein kinase domain-containing protein [Archangium sp.]
MESIGQPLWFGQYRLTSRIATGGMAEVYVGRHITPEGQFGPMVALKRLLPHLVKDSAIVRMFLNEARITAQINHPNVVKIYELGQTDGEPFIAMELLEGRTWADLRQRAMEDGRRMPAGVALRILADACRGLDAAHRSVDEQGHPLALVHRDFTPDNIHVGVKGDVKVIDFGIARTTTWGSGTEPGTLKGKFFYMSPEMITAKNVDHRADIFAAGVMLYEQLCGRRPFTGNSVDEVVIRIAREEPVPPSTYDPGVPRALDLICLKALAKEPPKRFQTLADFVNALEAVGGELVLAPSERVGEYVSQLFPSKDPLRDTLRRAREADPSVPNISPPKGAIKATPPSPIRTHQPAPEPVQVAAPVEPRKPSKFPMIIAALLVVAPIVGGGIWYSQRPRATATDQLAKAEALEGDEQVSALTRLSTLEDVTEPQLARAGALLQDNKSWDAALTVVDAWLLKNPKSLEARLLEGRAALESRKAKRAENALREAGELAPKDARPDALLAQLREAQGDASGAMTAWDKAATKAPNNTQYLARQGYWLSQSGKLDEAEAALSRASRKKSDPTINAELGFVKYRKEQFDDALRILRGVVKEKPDLFEGHYYLAPVLFRKKDLAGARAEYLAADALSPTDSRALVGLCQLEQMAQNATELEAAKARLKERFPKDADALLSQCAAAAP